MKWGGFFSSTDEGWYETQRWENLSAGQQAGETAWAWDRWVIASCAERNGGHAWWLDWDEEDGLWLHCQHCPAGVDELYPDGQDLIFAELPLPDGRTLRIEYGSAALDAPAQEWHGPVRAWAETDKHYSWEYGGWEYDARVFVEAVTFPGLLARELRKEITDGGPGCGGHPSRGNPSP